MANICFNAKQCDEIPSSYRQSMRECQEAWDAAVLAYHKEHPHER